MDFKKWFVVVVVIAGTIILAGGALRSLGAI